ncbi:MAG: hypothetical protein ACJ8AI_24845 [Rhodopila sp.]
MSDQYNFIVIPYLLAFLLSVKRYYFRDAAGSIFRGSFLLAVGSMALAACYLILGALHALPSYSAVAFGIVGLLCLGAAVWQAFQL